jgi:Domain of unknown function (DUF4124)
MRTPAPHNIAGSTGEMHLKTIARILCVVLLVAASASPADAASPNGRKLYKWVDSQGMTHYGDNIPPEYATQEQHVINSQGVETERVEAQKSPEQLATEDQKRVDADQAASRDRNLLSTYAAVAEIERLRDQRLDLLTDQVKVTGQFLEVLDGRLKKLRVSSMRFRPYNSDPKAPPLPDQVAEDLVRVGTDIRTQQENLREKRSEEATMTKQFESDIARFKQLKGIH